MQEILLNSSMYLVLLQYMVNIRKRYIIHFHSTDPSHHQTRLQMVGNFEQVRRVQAMLSTGNNIHVSVFLIHLRHTLGNNCVL
jgi:hypothetical protein